MRHLYLIPAILFLVPGCQQETKMQPVQPGEMVEYRDPGIRYQISHPQGWVVNAEVGRARFYNAEGVSDKFLDPLGPYPIGVEISVDVIKTPNPAERMAEIAKEMSAAGFQLGQQQTITVAGQQATKVPYAGNYGNKNIVNGHHVYVMGDSMLMDLGFAGFGDHYEAYAAVFDTALKSFVPPRPVEKGRDESLPSDLFTDYDAKLFTFEYPDNFNTTNPPKGKNELVIGLRGVRLDCNIQFDVFGAQGLTVEKVFDQNKGKYKGATSGKGTIGGQPALYLTYAATRDVERRVYFVVKNDKVFRVTMDWYKPQRTEYLQAYDKVISSIKFK